MQVMCVEIVLDDDSEAFYGPQSYITMLLYCDHEFILNGTTHYQPMNVTWMVGGQQIDPSEGDVLQMGH